MDKIIAKIEKVTYLQAFFIAVMMAGFYYFTSFDSGEALDIELAAIQGQTTEKQTLIAQTNRSIEEKKKFEKQVAEVAQTHGKALEFLPVELDVQELRAQLIQQARLAGTDIVRVNPQSIKNQRDKYEENFFDVELLGGYSGLATFLANVSKIPRLINVKSVKIKTARKDEDGPVLQFSAVLVVYRYLGEE